MGNMNKRKHDTGDWAGGAEVSLESERIAVGRLLRESREARGLRIEDVASDLCIRARHLQALELGEAKDLPGGPYTLGFVRAYAEYLGLNGQDLAKRYRREGGAEQAQQRLYFPEPVPDQRTPIGAVLLIAVVLASVVYGGWYYLSANNRTVADLVAPLPGELTALLGRSPNPFEPPGSDVVATASTETQLQNAGQGETNLSPDRSAVQQAVEFADVAPAAGAPVTETFSPPAEDDGDTAPAESAVAGTLVAETPVAETPVAETPVAEAILPATPPASIGSSVPPIGASVAETGSETPTITTSSVSNQALSNQAPSSQITPNISAPGQASAAALAEGRVFGADGSAGRIVIRAVQDSWVQVRDAQGELLITRVLRPGDQYRVPDQTGLTLVTGNAGGLEILVDGTVAPRLGRPGDVLRGVALDTARLVAGTAAGR